MNDEARESFRAAAERCWWFHCENDIDRWEIDEAVVEAGGRSRFRELCLGALVEGVERLFETLDDPDPLSWSFACELGRTDLVEETVWERAAEVYPRPAVECAAEQARTFSRYWHQIDWERFHGKGPRRVEFRQARSEPFGCFSNFSHHAVVIDDVEWPTTEHYYQAMKFPHASGLQRSIREAPRPGSAKRIAYKSGVDWRPDWEEVRVEVMLEALRAKFSQHPRLAKVLLLTEDDELVEQAPEDPFWGDGGDGSGENVLGRLLMQVREELRDEDRFDRLSRDT